MSSVVNIAWPYKRTADSRREPGANVLRQIQAVGSEFEAQSGFRCEVRVDPEHVSFDPSVGEVIVASIRTALDFIRQRSTAAKILVASKKLRSGYTAIDVGDPRNPPATRPRIRLAPRAGSQHAATPTIELSFDGGLNVRILLPPLA